MRQRQRRIVEPVRAVGAGEAEDQRVDDAPLGIEHEAHRQDRRDRRHRPGQDEQQRQPLDPPARAARKSPTGSSATIILTLIATTRNTSVLTTDAQEDRVLEQLARSSPDGAPARARSRPDRARRPRTPARRARAGCRPQRLPRRHALRAGPAGGRLRVGQCDRRHAVRSCCDRPPRRRAAGRGRSRQPATCLMRAIISSTALSTGDLLVDDAVHRLGPDVLVVEDRELVVLGEFERHRAGAELVVHRLAVRGRPARTGSAAPSWSPGTSGRASLRRTACRFSSCSRNATNSLAAPCSSRPRRSRRS